VKRIVTTATLVFALLGFTGPGAAGEATLGAAAAASGRYFGAALDPGDFDEKRYRELAATQLTSVTPENAMKWGPVEPARGQFDWKGADALVAFAKANGQRSGATRWSGIRSCRHG
jgi:endo-1,4-beta-xylanase